ncbi:MAG: DUF924 domain-containing protein [Gammaproteobacteria bacterium]|nr:DUF924 domain-containing protein [Gammaproteobacteria bacterium]
MTAASEANMQQDIIDFWFSDETRKLWFNSTPEFDQLLRARYLETWEQAGRGEIDHWMQSADGCVALVIVLDQFPLNMFRGDAQAFATEDRSRDVARFAIERGFDESLSADKKGFLYMPFMHSENLEDQDLSLRLFDQPGLESSLRFAHHHHDIVARFGRFPHRNASLGRTSTAAEIEYLNSKQAFTG